MSTSMYKIEKGVPIPPKSRGPGRRSRYPFMDMDVGDRFFVPEPDPAKRPRLLRDLCGSCRPGSVPRKAGRRFTVRIVEGGVACWRIA